MKAEQNRPSVVVIGAGFAGLEAVRALSDADVDVTLVDSKNHHCFQPLLYQVATAALSPADVAWPIRSILAGQRNVTVLMSEVKGVDPVARTVTTADDLLLHFDYLVLATGVTSSYFNHPEWARYAPGLKTIEDATRIRARILLSFERAERSDRKADLTFVVVGGGPTGVELAGSIADIAHHALAGDFRNINPEDAKIILIEAGQRILLTFPEDLSAYARRSLVDMGVEVITGVAVTDCDANGVSISDGRRIESSCVLWAAGVKASPAASWLGIEADRAGRIKVDEHLRVPGFRSIFAVGDIAAANSGGKPVPGLAPAAKQMGRYAGLSIAGDVLLPSTKVRPFIYHHQGDLATIGRKSAVVSLHRLRLKGFLGWLFWGVAHIYFLIGARNRAVVAVNWIWEYLTFQRGARLIS
jgi:NADH:ubiquinone reductase (H+-translocating)